MKIIAIIIVISSFYSLSEAALNCIPWGLRLALGRKYFNSHDNETLSIRFNTYQLCNQSFVTIVKDSTIRKMYCQTKKIGFSNYTTYLHRCSTNFIQKGQRYEYMAFGWTGSDSDSPTPYTATNIKSSLFKDDENIKLLVLADWGYLQKKAKIYNTLENSFASLSSSKYSQQPDIVYLGGDYGYELSSNYGHNYETFLIMLSQVSSLYPCIFTTGNHEYYTDNDFMLFNESFQLYDLTIKNVTSLDFDLFHFVLFDPYSILYENATINSLLPNFKSQIDRIPRTKPLIFASHYPLACSVASSHCSDERFILQSFFEMMIDYNAILYIGAHKHTYERIYPYVKGGNFILQQSPYIPTPKTKYLVSVVEGIAGNDKNIVEQYENIVYFTAALSFNQTGYGMMNINRTTLVYEHFKSTDWVKSVDSFKIYLGRLIDKQLRED